MRLLIITLTASLLSTTAFANCGPTLEFETKYNQEHEYENGIGGYSGNAYSDQGRGNSYSLGLSLEIPLTTIECDDVEAQTAKRKADTREKNADAMEQRLRNFERLLNICRKQETLPVCGRLEDMSKQLGLE